MPRGLFSWWRALLLLLRMPLLPLPHGISPALTTLSLRLLGHWYGPLRPPPTIGGMCLKGGKPYGDMRLCLTTNGTSNHGACRHTGVEVARR